MEKKVAAIWVLGILCATTIAFGALWFAPFEDDVVKGEVSGKIKLANITIPLDSILKASNPQGYSAPTQIPDNPIMSYPLSIDAEVNETGREEANIIPINIGDVTVEADIQIEGKNIDKLIRGILPIILAQNTQLKVEIDEGKANLIFTYGVILITLAALLEIAIIGIRRGWYNRLSKWLRENPYEEVP